MIAIVPELRRERYALRVTCFADAVFERRLFETARPDAEIIAQWPAAQRQAFYDSQFALQSKHYRQYFADAAFLIVTRAGEAVGRLILDENPKEWRIVDIALMPEIRGQGVGSGLIRSVQRSAAAAGAACLVLQVQVQNVGAWRLYERLGFKNATVSDAYAEMIWRPKDRVS